MLILQDITYIHQLRTAVRRGNKHDKIALTGNNGTGKSTLISH